MIMVYWTLWLQAAFRSIGIQILGRMGSKEGLEWLFEKRSEETFPHDDRDRAPRKWMMESLLNMVDSDEGGWAWMAMYGKGGSRPQPKASIPMTISSDSDAQSLERKQSESSSHISSQPLLKQQRTLHVDQTSLTKPKRLAQP